MKKFKIILAFVISLVLFVSTMAIGNKLAKDKLGEKAFTAASLETEVIKRRIRLILLFSNWDFGSFMSGFCEIRPYPGCSADYDYMCVIPKEQFRKMNKAFITQRMKAFLTYSTAFHSITYILNPGISPEAPRGYALQFNDTDTEPYNILKITDIYNTDFYRTVAQARHPITCISQNIRDSSVVWTIGVPIFDDEEEMIGELWTDMEADYQSQLLNVFQTSDNMKVFIMSDDRTVLTSLDASDNGKKFSTILEEKEPDSKWKEWGKEMEEYITSGTDTSFVIQYKGIPSYIYIRKLKDTQFFMIVVKSLDIIIRDVDQFTTQFLIMSLTALLFLIGCLIYIFLELRRENLINRKMENELDVASGIQKRILPPDVVKDDFEVYGFQKQAKSVGGDLYDYFLKDGKLHFCIGDVSGKGVPASLVMTELCSLYRYIAKRCGTAREIVCTLNSALMEHSDDTMICTLFIGILDLSTGYLDYCNAGHTPPVLLCAEKPAATVAVKANMPIFAFENYSYKSDSIRLNRGDRLFLYTDGVTEACNRNREMLGSKAMRASIDKNNGKTPKGLIEGLLNDISVFTDKAEQNDDITLMCIEYKG